MSSDVLAAGAVCWRKVSGQIWVLMIHRTAHKDFTIPKGKLDDGESLPQTAIREIREETGLSVTLGIPLGVSTYELSGGKKKHVHYWAARVSSGMIAESGFEANDEVEKLEWLPLADAKKRASYREDVDVLDAFESYCLAGVVNTFAVIFLRHAQATSPHVFADRDRSRPLTPRGVTQSKTIAATLSAWKPKKLFSSTALRCHQSATLLSETLSLEVKTFKALSQDSYESGVSEFSRIISKRLDSRKTAIIVSHAPVIPALVNELAKQTGSDFSQEFRASSYLNTAHCLIVHLTKQGETPRIVALQNLGPE